jgi:hypothetical protein
VEEEVLLGLVGVRFNLRYAWRRIQVQTGSVLDGREAGYPILLKSTKVREWKWVSAGADRRFASFEDDSGRGARAGLQGEGRV